MIETHSIKVLDLQPCSSDVRQAAEILADEFTSYMGAVFPKGVVTKELLSWRIAGLERIISMRDSGLPHKIVVAKRIGSSDVLGVAAWSVKSTEQPKDGRYTDEVPPVPPIPKDSGDVDEMLWFEWRKCFDDVSKRYGEDRASQWIELSYLAVQSDAQRSGIGSALIQSFLQDSMHRTDVIFLITAPTVSAAPFYLKHGFESMETLHVLPGLPGNHKPQVMQYQR